MGLVNDISPADIADIRKSGDLHEFLMLLAGKPVTTPTAAPEPEQTQPDPNRRPGAWPAGTRPPSRVEPADPAAWQQAVEDYRTSGGAGEGNCQCTGCQTPRSIR